MKNALFSVALAAAVAACGQTNDEPSEATGSVGVSLEVAPGVTLDSVNYAISGPGSFSTAGPIDVSHSQAISALIGGLPAGPGFNITLTAVLSDKATTCSGAAVFDVVAGQTAPVSIHLLCHEPERTGSVLVNGTLNVCPSIDALSASPAEVNVGGTLAITAAAHDLDSGPSALAYHFSASAGTLSAADVPNPTFTCTAPGPATITLNVTDGDCGDSATAVVTCSDGGTTPPAAVVKVNEVESSGGTPGDWIELVNPNDSSVDIGGWVVRDNDDSHTYDIPDGTSIPAGGFFVVEEAAMGFGLGSADAARLFRPDGTTLVDSFSWTSHATTTYGRCPDGTGDFVTTLSSTKGAANDCPGANANTIPWPGSDKVKTVDPQNEFSGNMSGLFYEKVAQGDILWAVQNGPSMVYRLTNDGTSWVSSTDNDWTGGKAIVYPDGMGGPDSEGITRAELDTPFIYVSTERDNTNNSVSKLSILRYDTSAAGKTLTATHEWNLTADLPAAGANLGLEAITWVPDTFLVANGFIDESTQAAYDPAAYPDHGTGIFFVGVEASGMVYGYALNHADSSFHRVASLTSGHPTVMDLSFDRDIGTIWADCDNSCGNEASILALRGGHFQVARFVEKPSTLPDVNNEGAVFQPVSECVDGQRAFFWSDDANTDGHSLRQDTIPCVPLF